MNTNSWVEYSNSCDKLTHFCANYTEITVAKGKNGGLLVILKRYSDGLAINLTEYFSYWGSNLTCILNEQTTGFWVKKHGKAILLKKTWFNYS